MGARAQPGPTGLTTGTLGGGAPLPDFEPRAAGNLALAVELGTSSLAAGLVDERGDVVSSLRVPLAADGSPPPAGDLARRLLEVVDAVLAGAGLVAGQAQDHLMGAGVAVTGRVDRDAGTVTPRGAPSWRGYPVRDLLAQTYGVRTGLVTDAVAVAIAEHWRGAARGRRNVLGLVIDDDIGGGLILQGRVVVGPTGNAGQIGHISVDPYGPGCVCGGRGCLTAIASGRAVVTHAAAHGFAGPADLDTVAQAARHGDPIALASFRRAGEAIGLGMATATTLLDLDVVVVTGRVAGVGAVLFDPVADGYARYAALPYASNPRVVPAELDVDSVLIGAAALVIQPQNYRGEDARIIR